MVKNNSFKEIWGKLKACKKVALTLHAGPDGDSLGSCAAMKYVLERDFKCKVVLVSYDSLDEVLMGLPYAKEVKFGTDISDLNLKDYDAVIFMDSSQVSGRLRDKYAPPNETFIINIDHHVDFKYPGSLNYIDPSAPSNCSVLMELFRDVGVKFDKELSTRLMLGLCTDTGFFKYGKEKASSDASFLKEHGADYDYIVSAIKDKEPEKMKEYYSYLDKNFKTASINGKVIGYSVIDARTISQLDINLAEIRKGPNYLWDMKEFDVLFTLAEMEGYIKGSFRSKNGVDVSKFASMMNGSGHKGAAGFRIDNATLKQAEKQVFDVLKKHL